MVILPESHLDHGLTPEQRAWLLATLSDREGFFIVTVELPPELGTVPCGLHGPRMGDPPVPEEQVRWASRGDRAWPSRLTSTAPRPTRQVTVIAGPEGDIPTALYTAFGGPLAPREPGDPTLEGEALVEAQSFWSEHALSLDAGPEALLR